MSRIITSKRDTKAGTLYHYCPIREGEEARITPEVCAACPHLADHEPLTTRYRIHCDAPVEGPELREFEPPKAHDTYQGLKGLDLVKSEEHYWIEPKLDGARALIHCTSDGVVITSRRRNKLGSYNQFQNSVPHLRDHPGLVAIGKEGYTILDGEVVMPVDTDTLAATMGVVGANPERAIETQKEKGWLVLHLFDMVMEFGQEMSELSLLIRRAMLGNLAKRYLLGDPGKIELVPYQMVVGSSAELRVAAALDLVGGYMERGLEGAVIKNPDAGYFDSQAWLKVKSKVTVDAIVTGWEVGATGGKYENTLGALKVSVLNIHGEIIEIARVTPGDDAIRDKLFNWLNVHTDKQIVEAAIIVEMESQCWTKDYRLRHPRILRYRRDRSDPNTVDFASLTTA